MRRVLSVLRSDYSGLSHRSKILTNAGQYRLEVRRCESSVASTACWNCKKWGKQMICTDCGCLQDVSEKINYFELLSFPTKFSVPTQELTQRFRQLQSQVHPDKYSNKTSREQTNSADWSSLINKAYKTLSAPVERGQYMLQLEGQEMPQDNSALNSAFLMAMMERNEEVEEANDSQALDELNAQIVKELDQNAQKLNTQFDSNDLSAIKQTLVEMKYLLSIQSSIKKKQQQLMGSS